MHNLNLDPLPDLVKPENEILSLSLDVNVVMPEFNVLVTSEGIFAAKSSTLLNSCPKSRFVRPKSSFASMWALHWGWTWNWVLTPPPVVPSGIRKAAAASYCKEHPKSAYNRISHQALKSITVML